MKSKKEKSSKDKGKDCDEQRLKNEKNTKKIARMKTHRTGKGDVRAGGAGFESI